MKKKPKTKKGKTTKIKQEPVAENTINEQDTKNQKAEPTKIEKIQTELKEEKDKYLRLYAEFENFRRRTAKERLELYETAGEGVIKNLLPVLDDFERAMGEMKKNGENEFLKGVELIFDKLIKTLEKEGLNRVNVEKGEEFDAEIHEAIAQIPVEDDKMKQKIVDVVEQGYQLGKKIIRFPKVVTGR